MPTTRGDSKKSPDPEDVGAAVVPTAELIELLRRQQEQQRDQQELLMAMLKHQQAEMERTRADAAVGSSPPEAK